MRVVIVDDHPVFRQGMATLLAADGLDVVGQAASATEALRVVDTTAPDVVLMDLGLPDGSGVQTTERITATHPGVRVVVVTMFDDDASVRASLDAGASGYVVKDADPEEILAVLRAAAHGARVVGSGVGLPVSDRPEPAVAATTHLEAFGLTPREQQLAVLMGKGLPNPVIAARLGLSTKTVANYVSVVLLKLGARDRGAAIETIRTRLDRQ